MCRGESVGEGPGSKTWILLLMFLASGPSAFAQSVDFLPEIDARFKLKSFMRVMYRRKTTGRPERHINSQLVRASRFI